MLAKWEVYLIIGVGLVLAMIAAGAYERHVGYQEAVADARDELDKANKKVDAAEKHLQELSDAQATRIETLSTNHERELAAATGTLHDRLCGGSRHQGGLPAASGAPGVPAPAEPGAALPPSLESPTFAADFVKACQHDADSVDGWNEWWIEQQAALRKAFPEMQPAG